MSRKYRQRGYQDDGDRDGDRGRERSAPRSPRSRSDRLRPDRPGGRGLGSPGRQSFRCADCGKELDPPETTEAICASCSSPLHTCTNCRHFDRSARFQCGEPIPEPVRAKAKANDCGHFAPKIVLTHERESADPSDPRAAFDALFDNL